jgi:4,5:9,10-diseco-3-hydroxy-5,9,17-trioxoandrosta-1(10),2-diene-4-oate hydrolase
MPWRGGPTTMFCMNTPSPIPVGHFADIGNGQQIHFHDAGPRDGHAVIFLHGAGGGASGYSNFKGNFPAFAEAGYRAIVMDMLGFGLSSKPDIPQYDLAFFVDALKRFITALGLQRVTLLGNSLGGAIALGHALAHPADVERLMLMAPGGVEDIDTYLAMPGIANMFAIYKSGKTGVDAMRAVMQMQLFDPSLLTEEIINERAPIAATQTQAARSVMPVPNMTTRLVELQCPVFGFWGVNDQFNPVGGAMKIMQNAPQARMVLVNRCGHWVQVEHQAMFNRQCLDFLRNG